MGVWFGGALVMWHVMGKFYYAWWCQYEGVISIGNVVGVDVGVVWVAMVTYRGVPASRVAGPSSIVLHLGHLLESVSQAGAPGGGCGTGSFVAPVGAGPAG